MHQISFLQVLLLIRQMEHSNTQSVRVLSFILNEYNNIIWIIMNAWLNKPCLQGAAKVSILMIGQQAIIDAYLCLLHLTAGILVGKLARLFLQHKNGSWVLVCLLFWQVTSYNRIAPVNFLGAHSFLNTGKCIVCFAIYTLMCTLSSCTTYLSHAAVSAYVSYTGIMFPLALVTIFCHVCEVWSWLM